MTEESKVDCSCCGGGGRGSEQAGIFGSKSEQWRLVKVRVSATDVKLFPMHAMKTGHGGGTHPLILNFKTRRRSVGQLKAPAVRLAGKNFPVPTGQEDGSTAGLDALKRSSRK